jgi:hypothetical protein
LEAAPLRLLVLLLRRDAVDLAPERLDVALAERAAPPLAPLARAAAAFFGVRVLPAFDAASERLIFPPRLLALLLRLEAAVVFRVEVDAAFRFAVPVEREAVLVALRVVLAFFVPALARPPFAAAAVRPAAPRAEVDFRAELPEEADFRVELPEADFRAAVPEAFRVEVLEALRVEVPLALRVEVEEAAFLVPALARPPFAAAAVRPAAPRAELDLRAVEVPEALRAGLARRRFGFSSACGWVVASCSVPSGVACVSSLT